MKRSSFLIAAVCALLAILMQTSGLLELPELKTIDMRFLLRDSNIPLLSADSPAFDDVVIIGIDDKSISRIPEPFILWDTFVAEIIEKLGKYQSRVIGLDLIWSKSIDQFVKRNFKEKNALKKALLITKNKYRVPIIMGIGGIKKDTGENTPASLDSSIPLKRFGIILGRSNFGVINTYPDKDKFIRRQQTIYQSAEAGEPLPGFDLLIASRFLGKAIVPEITIPLINYQHHTEVPVYSFYEVLQKAQQDDSAYFQNNFKDKIVLLGITDVSADRLPTPLGTETSGIILHAHAINTYIKDNYLLQSNVYTTLGIIVLSALVIGIISALFRLPAAILLLLVLTALYLAVAVILFGQNYVVPIMSPLLAMLTTFGFSFLYRFTIEDKNKRKLARYFKSYVNEQVVKQILNSDTPVSLMGQREAVSILFADIRGFTTYSEMRSPEQVVATLNEYLSAMTDAILDNGGTLDKFIGDGIMAFFGAPLKLENPTLNAVHAALEMRRKLDELNAKWVAQGQPALDNGIGIHSGYALIGNIGSQQKMEYTAIGDSVNLASRIEGLTKNFKTPILLSEDAYNQVKAQVITEYQGNTAVKGRANVNVYSLVELTE